MSAEPVIAEGLEELLTHVRPDLRLVPDYYPTPDPILPMGPLDHRIDWSDVYDWVKDETRHLLPQGRDITEPFLADAAAQTEAMVGEAMKAMSGFIDQNAALTVQAASFLETTIDNVERNRLFDFQEQSLRMDRLEATQEAIIHYVVPNLQAQIAHAEAFAYSTAVAAQHNAEQWATQNIFRPLYAEMLKVQPAIDASAAKVEAHVPDTVHKILNALNPVLHPELGAALAPLRAAAKWTDDCGIPMCDVMGPKTDLGKLLKGLKLAATVAMFAQLMALDEDKLAALIRALAAHVTGIIDEFSHTFVEGGGSIGDVIKNVL